jgi:predicted dehydrogenase
MPRRWGILGAGGISFSHATALIRSPHADLIAIADIDPAARERAAQFGVPTFGSSEQLLDSARPDAVTIALPQQLHLEGTRLAASRGVHVLCEKPLAPTVAESDEMIALCAAKGVQLGAILNNRGYAQVRWLRERILDGSIHPRAFTVTLAMAAPVGRDGPELASAMLIGAGIHYLDLLAWWLGPLVEVGVITSAGSATCAALRFESASGVFRVSSVGTRPRQARIDIDADEGHLAFVGASIAEIDADLGAPPAPHEVVEGMRFGTGHLVVIDEAAAALDNDQPFPVSGHVGRAAVAMVERIEDAVRGRARQTVT